MALYVMELSDAGVRLGGEDGHLAESPGYALVQGDRLLLGEQARREARLHPRHTHTHFWSRLSTDALPQPGPRARTVADLAYAHLLDLWNRNAPAGNDDQVVFAVPGHFDRNQLALLLGIARECPFTAVGLVDLAVAAVAAEGASADTVLHLGAHLHRTVITRITASEELVRDRVDDTAATALLGLQDAMVGLIADAFIRETRFDPLHEAGTEQRLYDHLPDWLQELDRSGEAILELDTGRNRYRVSMHQDRLVERLRPRYEQLAERMRAIADDGNAEIRLDARLAALPGLVDILERQLDSRTVRVESTDAVRCGTLAHLDQVRRDGERLAFVTRLPNRTPVVPDSDPSPPPSAPAVPAVQETEKVEVRRPTHLLLGHEAWPLHTSPLRIGGAPGDGVLPLPGAPEPLCTVRVQEGGIRLDPELDAAVSRAGRPLQRAVHLAPGDEVMVGEGIRLTPIVVHGDD